MLVRVTTAIPAGAVTLHRKAFDLLDKWGWGPFLAYRAGWEKRGNGHRQPRVQDSVMIHHTGGIATSTDYLVRGDPGRDLPGPLCNVHIDPGDRRIRLLGAGPASHAGNGTKANYDRMRAGTAPSLGDMAPRRPDGAWSANRYSVGVEVDGVGGSREWDEWTKRAVLAVSTAFNIAGGWAKDGKLGRVWAHKEHTYRKPGDPFADMGVLRAAVRDAIASGAVIGPDSSSPVVMPVLGKRVLSKNGIDRGPDVAELAALLKAKGYDTGTPADVFGPKMDAAVRAEQAKLGLTVDGIVGPLTVTALKGEKLPEPQPGTPAEPTEPAPEPPVQPEPPKEPQVPAQPEPQPVPAKVRDFRLLQINTLNKERFPSRQGVRNTSKLWPAWLADQKPSVMLLCETNETRRGTIKADPRFKAWKSWATGYVCVFWDSRKWTHTRTAQFDYGNGIHGAAVVTLRDKGTGLEADFVSIHLPPNAAFPPAWSEDRKAKGKRDALTKWLGKVLRPGATFVGGDYNTETHAQVMQSLKFSRMTPAVNTNDEGGKLDAVWHRPGKRVKTRVRGTPTLLDPRNLGDHKGWLVNGTIEIPAPLPTN